MSMDSWLGMVFMAGLMLGGIGGIYVACTLVGRNMRKKRHEKIDNVIYNKKLSKALEKDNGELAARIAHCHDCMWHVIERDVILGEQDEKVENTVCHKKIVQRDRPE